MIGTIRRHSTWLWFIIIAAMGISLVVVFQPGSTFLDSQGRSSGNYGEIDGQRIGRDELANAQREVNVRYFLQHGGVWPDQDPRKTGFDVERETYQWLFFISKLKEYNIQIDSRSVAQAVDELLRQFGRGTPVSFDVFVQRVLLPHASADDFERFIRHDLGIQQLVSVVGLSGKLVAPEEGRFLYERDHQELATEAVFFSASNYLASVAAPPPEALSQFYTNEMSAYHVPERVQVRYVAFGISNFVAQAEKQLTNLTAMAESRLRQLGTNYLRFGKTPEEVKSRIREELIHAQASADAQKAADDLANVLFGMEPVQPGNLVALARTNGLDVRITRPFDEDNGPTEFDGGPNFAKEAFRLSPEKPFPDQPIAGESAVYLIAFEKRIPDEILPLDQIRERVKADYKYRQAVLMARSAGENLVRAATNGLAHGKTFAGICAEAKVKPVAVPPFSLSTRELPEVEDHATLTQFKQIAFSTTPGKVNDFSSTRDGGFVLYVQKRLPVDESKARAELPAFLNLIRRAREQESFNFWFARESSISLRNIPLMQRKPSTSPPAGAEP